MAKGRAPRGLAELRDDHRGWVRACEQVSAREGATPERMLWQAEYISHSVTEALANPDFDRDLLYIVVGVAEGSRYAAEKANREPAREPEGEWALYDAGGAWVNQYPTRIEADAAADRLARQGRPVAVRPVDIKADDYWEGD